MIIGIGIDIIEVDRIKKMLLEYSDRAFQKIFTETEIIYCNSFGKRKYEHFAARFAIKEAFSKAIGTGLTNSFSFKDVGVENRQSGEPVLILKNKMKEKYDKYKIYISIAHTEGNATGIVVIENSE